MSLVKPAGIQGLNTGHALHANIAQFFELGQTNKEMVTDTALTYGGTAGSDADLGDSVLFTSANVGVSLNALISESNTALFVYKHVGASGQQGSGGRFEFFNGQPNGNNVLVRYEPLSTPINYQVFSRANFSSSPVIEFYPFTHADSAAYSSPHALAVTFDPLNATQHTVMSFDGAMETPINNNGSPASDYAAPPVSVNIAPNVGAVGDTRLAAVVVFNKILTTAEMNSVTTDPWAMVSTGPSLAVTQATLTPGGTISGTYADYATIPTTLTVSDGTNTITIPTPSIDDTAKTFSGTMPALPTTGTANLVLFGNVTVSLT